MRRIFDAHVHYSYEIPLNETERVFKREFDILGVEKMAFLSLPHHAVMIDGELKLTFSPLQNVKGLYLKKAFSPNAYAFAGLEHPYNCISEKDREMLYLKQAEEYYANGFDGMKMLEGYPSMRKVMGISLCDRVYDSYYSFLEENNIPVIMHIANPEENWDINRVDAYALKVGRYCDETYPTKAALHAEVDEIMKKHPRLRLTLAHFGFLTYNIEKAKEFLDRYPNTCFDITPGGEQFFNILADFDRWHDFFVAYQDRIVYGTDLYAFSDTNESQFISSVVRRPCFIRDFFDAGAEHEYCGDIFRGVKMDEEILEKIFYKNSLRMLLEPKKINENYLLKKCESLLVMETDEKKKVDLNLIINGIMT